VTEYEVTARKTMGPRGRAVWLWGADRVETTVSWLAAEIHGEAVLGRRLS
jgi:hypothetical protein